MTTDEREDWDALTKTPGWQRLVAFAKSQWAGAAYKQKVSAAVRENNLAQVATVDTVADEINILLTYPLERMKELDKVREREQVSRVKSPSRRGSL